MSSLRNSYVSILDHFSPRVIIAIFLKVKAEVDYLDNYKKCPY